MDREADIYRLEAALVEKTAEFVIRASHLDRKLVGGGTLDDATQDVRTRLKRDVPLSERKATTRSSRSKQPPRPARTAELSIGATTIIVPRSWPTKVAAAPELVLNVVHVWEPDPPTGEAPVAWTLLTTLPIATTHDLAFIVDLYRRRWLIEELFKALKTGCQFEKLQLESANALLNALAIMLPIAAGLLALRHIARARPTARAEDVLSELQIKILRIHEHTRNMSLATAADAMLAVARLGGHIKNNGDPGWIVLGRGYEDLRTYEAGARFALQM
jgi:hypothetical protein